MFFDTHTHLDQEEFDDIRSEVLARARDAGVTELVAVGTTATASEKCVSLSQQHAGVFAAVGIQPNYVADAAPDDWQKITQLVKEPGVVAIGETGLDRYWDFAPFDLQQDYFDRHLRLSQQLDLPFVVHMRDCDKDIMVMLREARQRGPLRGIMHSFTGGMEMAAECVEIGLHISFAGMLTFKKSQALRECAVTVPDERLLIETDAPYLSPEPVRGKKPNEPANVVHTAECLARVRGVSTKELAGITTRNARELFRIDSK
ncbi:TatD family hydrolase [Bythopirellula polymerisocia]|uniref:Putative deoxyribonuclease YcfH n=1 Tax=Bythopirellula polymerisocia TaxID=2528003 RepID=A0A5C6CSB6_9BACT|nr:TatD family hydrolase [Bythopirellula polymerisocia]TWU25976.1 putative deoxyribonuclease YcfH [Bythopirellula polymerisocia]